jgi:hypothetical protein
LHFHALRHEGRSRLFEAVFTIEQVALVTGHKDWKILRRHTHELRHRVKPRRICDRKGAYRKLTSIMDHFRGAPHISLQCFRLFA